MKDFEVIDILVLKNNLNKFYFSLEKREIN